MRLVADVCTIAADFRCVTKRRDIFEVKIGVGAAELKQLESPEVCRGLSLGRRTKSSEPGRKCERMCLLPLTKLSRTGSTTVGQSISLTVSGDM